MLLLIKSDLHLYVFNVGTEANGSMLFRGPTNTKLILYPFRLQVVLQAQPQERIIELYVHFMPKRTEKQSQ